MFDLINIFDTFLPQLLLYPNPSDPLNPEAAALMLDNSKKYEEKVREYVKKYAKSEKEDEDAIEEEDCPMEIEDENLSLSQVSELSETSDIALME